MQQRSAAAETPATSVVGGGDGDGKSGYERMREERIRGNLERMQQLGIPDLSLKLKSTAQSEKRSGAKRPRELSSAGKAASSPPTLRRRSSRLQNLTPVIYNEVRRYGFNDSLVDVGLVREGERPEMYTEEDEKLLGTYENEWVLFVDGYDSNRNRIYDQVTGKTCHQCRQKTLGHRTTCSSCSLVQGQFCGDCLFMRYGENVLEANQNPSWICPVCRGICNCSLCRIKKGWAPTGSLYRRICRLGYKSVAHYLIQTQRVDAKAEDSQLQHSAKRSLPFTDSNGATQLDSKAKDSQLEHSVKMSLPFTDSIGTSQVDATSPFADSNGATQFDDAVRDSENFGTESSNRIIKTTAELKGKDLTIDLNLEIIGLEKLAGDDMAQTNEVSAPWTQNQGTGRKLRCKTKATRASPSTRTNPDSIKGRLRPPRPLTILN